MLPEERKTRKKMFYLTTHSQHFIYGYIASGIWYRNTLEDRKPAAITTWATLFN